MRRAVRKLWSAYCNCQIKIVKNIDKNVTVTRAYRTGERTVWELRKKQFNHCFAFGQTTALLQLGTHIRSNILTIKTSTSPKTYAKNGKQHDRLNSHYIMKKNQSRKYLFQRQNVILRGRVDDLSFFDYLSPFCFLLIEFYCTFPFLRQFYQIMFIISVFRLGCARPSGLLLFVPAVLFSILTPLFCPSSSVSLSYFILAVAILECLGKHSCMSSPFPIAILNGTSSFLSLVQENINMPSGHYYRLCS